MRKKYKKKMMCDWTMNRRSFRIGRETKMQFTVTHKLTHVILFRKFLRKLFAIERSLVFSYCRKSAHMETWRCHLHVCCQRIQKKLKLDFRFVFEWVYVKAFVWWAHMYSGGEWVRYTKSHPTKFVHSKIWGNHTICKREERMILKSKR